MEHETDIREAIASRIREAGGRIPFRDYMELCLYHPSGYYQNRRQKLGKEGDFYTSAHVGRAMGQAIATCLSAASRTFGGDRPVAIVEWGGGDGRLAEAVLDELAASETEWYRRLRFLAVENSPLHREAQRERLTAKHAGRLLGVVADDDPLVDRTLADCVTLLYANELLDAFPVHKLRRARGGWEEVYVEADDRPPGFRETTGPVLPAPAALLARYGIRGRPGQEIEIGADGLEWIRRLGAKLRAGFALFADYGDASAELYAEHRMNGTLATYRDHRIGDDPYRDPGERDITAHVNFEWCADAAAEAGFDEVRFVTQKRFLVDNGTLVRLQNHAELDPFSPAARSNRAIRQLLLSDGMSELFKVLTMYKRG